MRFLRAALICLLVGTALFLCQSCEKTPPRDKWNVLWIVVDDLMASHLGAAGYERNITPNIDRLAKDGVRFEHCVTQSPWSLPSYASMLTSRHPWELIMGDAYLMHIKAETDVARSRDPYRMPDMNRHWYVAMKDDVTTIAEVMKEEGLSTGAWVNNAWLAPKKYGMEQGFDHYFDGLADASPYTPADETVRLAGDWIEENRDGRWFAFVQLMDPHKPHRSHKDINFGDRIIDRYDAEIAFTDRAIGTLLDRLEEMGLSGRTLVIINADHGEGIFEQDKAFVGHGGGVIPEIVFVPLIIKWPGGSDDVTISALSRNLDIMPTVLELLKIDKAPDMDGTSLVDTITSREEVSAVPACTSSVLKGPEQVSAILQSGEDTFFQAIIIPPYQRTDLFEIRGNERKPVRRGPHAERAINNANQCVRESIKFLESAKRGMPAELDEDMKRKLETLGYIE